MKVDLKTPLEPMLNACQGIIIIIGIQNSILNGLEWKYVRIFVASWWLIWGTFLFKAGFSRKILGIFPQIKSNQILTL